MTRAEKLAAARGLLDEAARTRHTDIGLAAAIDALRLTLDLIEQGLPVTRVPEREPDLEGMGLSPAPASEDALPIPTYSAPLDANDGVSPAPDFAAMAMMLAGRSHEHCLEWLAANWPKPAPAVVPYAGCEHACWTGGKCRSCGRRDEDVAGDLRVARSMLEEKPALAVVHLPPRRIPREDDTADVMECVGWNAALDAVEAMREGGVR